MDERYSLSGHFLIAMPALADANFARTVTYICEHNDQGALGIVVNRPSELTLKELLSHMEIEGAPLVVDDVSVHLGGPVQRDRGFVLHPPDSDWDATLQHSGAIRVTTSRDILEAIAQGTGPERFRVALGYAGWGAGQLEQEMMDNAWLSGPARADLVFERDAEACWRGAAAMLGVDLSLISAQSGRA